MTRSHFVNRLLAASIKTRDPQTALRIGPLTGGIWNDSLSPIRLILSAKTLNRILSHELTDHFKTD